MKSIKAGQWYEHLENRDAWGTKAEFYYIERIEPVSKDYLVSVFCQWTNSSVHYAGLGHYIRDQIIEGSRLLEPIEVAVLGLNHMVGQNRIRLSEEKQHERESQGLL